MHNATAGAGKDANKGAKGGKKYEPRGSGGFPGAMRPICSTRGCDDESTRACRVIEKLLAFNLKQWFRP
jgi:hypothetical protein